MPRPPTLFLLGIVWLGVARLLEPPWLRLSLAAQAGGVLLLVAGLWLTVAAERRFRSAGTPVRHSEPSTVLVTEGPFAWSRNPMYLGMAVALAGLALLAATPFGLLAAPAFALAVDRCFVRHEEQALASTFGEAFSDYQSRVRRWI